MEFCNSVCVSPLLVNDFGARLLTVRDAAKFLSVSKDFVYRKWRTLGGFKLEGQIRFTEKAIAERVNEYARV